MYELSKIAKIRNNAYLRPFSLKVLHQKQKVGYVDATTVKYGNITFRLKVPKTLVIFVILPHHKLG